MRTPFHIFLLLAITLTKLAITSVIPATNESLVSPRAIGVGIPSALNRQGPQPWPKNQLLYRFANPESDHGLRRRFEDAWQIWKDHGLRLSKDEEQNQKKGVLLITMTQSGGIRTQTGYQPDVVIPMNIDVNADRGHSDLTTVIVHELGHALGLYHEHQKPIASTKIEVTYENLADWDESVKEAQAMGKGPEDLKTNFWVMGQVGSSCADVAPFSAQKAQILNQDNSDDIDWDSIMLYGSRFGGKIVGKNPQVVMKKKGVLGISQTFKAATVPSQRDVILVNSLHEMVNTK